MLQKRNTPETARARPAAFAWDDPFLLDEQLSEEEVEEETRRKVEEKRRRGRFWGLGKKRE